MTQVGQGCVIGSSRLGMRVLLYTPSPYVRYSLPTCMRALTLSYLISQPEEGREEGVEADRKGWRGWR